MSVPQSVRDQLRAKVKSELSDAGIDPSSVDINRGPTGYLTVTDPQGRLSGAYDVSGFGDALNLSDRFGGRDADNNTAGLGDRFEDAGAVGDAAAESFGEELADVSVEFSGGLEGASLAELWDRWQSEDVTGINVGDRSVVNFPDSGGGIIVDDVQAREQFASLLANAPDGALERFETDDVGGDPDLAGRLSDMRERRETREAARDAAEAAGVDLEEFGIDARADGEVIVQDRDTGRTRTIGTDTDGLGAAIDAETSDGGFVADAADPAAGATSGGGLGERAVGAIVLLFGALAAALGWLS